MKYKMITMQTILKGVALLMIIGGGAIVWFGLQAIKN